MTRAAAATAIARIRFLVLFGRAIVVCFLSSMGPTEQNYFLDAPWPASPAISAGIIGRYSPVPGALRPYQVSPLGVTDDRERVRIRLMTCRDDFSGGKSGGLPTACVLRDMYEPPFALRCPCPAAIRVG